MPDSISTPGMGAMGIVRALGGKPAKKKSSKKKNKKKASRRKNASSRN